MDIVTYALCKKMTLGAISGIDTITLDGTKLTFYLKDGTSVSTNIPLPKDGKNGIDGKDGKDGVNGTNGKDGVNGTDGVSIVDIKIEDGNLVCFLSDGNTINAGKLPESNGSGGEVGGGGTDESNSPHPDATKEDIDVLFPSDGNNCCDCDLENATEEDIDKLFL